jgi:peptidoglycan/LPS O-acetylase OafA/YrhL
MPNDGGMALETLINGGRIGPQNRPTPRCGATAFYIIAWIRFSENSVAERFLTARPMVFLGYTSYSIYLLHIPILVAVLRLVDFSAFHSVTRLIVGTLIVVPATLLLASATYRWIEQPAIRFGRAAAAFLLRLRSLGEDRQAAESQIGVSVSSASI